LKKNISLFFFTLIIVFVISEVFIRFFFPQDLQRYWVVKENKYGLSINESNYVHKLHRFKSFKAKYTFGKYGNRVTVSNDNLEKKDKILVLGESFTFGWLLKDEYTFIHKLQKDNLDYNFINVAVGAWGTGNYTLYTELYCKLINPKKIFVFMNTDDPYRGFQRGFYEIKNDKLISLKKEVKNIPKDSKFDKKIPFYKFFKSHSHLFMLTRNVVYNLINKPSYNTWSSEKYWPRPISNFDKKKSLKVKKLNEKIFIRLKEITKNCNSELYIFYTNWALPEMMSDENVNKMFLENAEAFFNDNQIYYFQNSKKMQSLYKKPMDYIIDIDFHPNSKGANLIYLSLKDEIKKILNSN
jgi:hypothetical protein